jgi:predicted ATPase
MRSETGSGVLTSDPRGFSVASVNRDATAPPAEPGLRPTEQSQAAIFACNGEYWTIGYADTAFTVRDVKGFSYIQRLLQHPGEEIHALDLVGGPGAGAVSEGERIETHESSLPAGVSFRRGLSGDSGEMLDAQAKQEYRNRLVDLNREMEESQQRGAADRADELQSEIDFLKTELSRAVGLGGRSRRAGSAAERARLSVTRAIRVALQRISGHHEALGERLSRCVRTGSFCSYIPGQLGPLRWQFTPQDSSDSAEFAGARTAFSRLQTGFLRAFADGTSFVGRAAERAAFAHFLEKVRSGEGRIVLIAGDAGVGKTRTAAELGTAASQRGMLTLVGSCYERDEPLPFSPFVEIMEAFVAQAQDLVILRRVLGDDAAEIARLIPQLRRLFPDIPRAIELPPDQSRRVLFAAVTDLVARIARNTPVLLMLDDLQWADEGTLLLLEHLARFTAKIPLLIVGTYRDYDLDPAGILTKTFGELIRLRSVHRMVLGGLSKDAVADMLRALSGYEAPEAIVGLFHADTEGNPFFIEELFRYLVEQGKLLDAKGEYRSDLALAELDVPETVRLVIGRRLARLSEETLKILGTAAAIGRSFTFELLTVSMKADPDSLLDYLEEAENSGLISSTVEYPEARFRFSHELVRQTVVSQVSVTRRQRLHLNVAEALESLNANAPELVANELAHHLLQAGLAADPSKTIRFLSMAAKRARLQGALTETAQFYRDALLVLKRILESHERDRLELGLQLGLGAVLMATRGYAYKETALAYERATGLGERLGDPTQVVLALTGLVSPPLLRGELDAAQAIADQALAASQRHGQSKTQIWGYHIAGVVQYHKGRLASAWDLLRQADAEYHQEEHKTNPQDPGSECLQYLALTAWHLGLADTARTRMNEAVDLTDRLQKPFELAHCSFYAAYLEVLLRNPKQAQALAEKAIKWSAEYSISLYLDVSRIVYGWALAQQGRSAEGVACARAALKSFQKAGNRLAIGSFLGFMAEMLLSAGLPEAAIAAVEQGFSLVVEPFDISYLWWLKGRVLLENAGSRAGAPILQLDKSRLEDAEKSFRTALSLATNIGAKSYAIRSATSLGRLLSASGKSAEARAIVEPLLKSMTEGFDTREFVDAKQLMEDLS